MIKLLYIVLGSVSLSLGFLGIFLPGLPTTPFLLLAATLYMRSSKRLYSWLLNHRQMGKIIRQFRENKSIPLRIKIVSLSVMWSMIGLSTILLLKSVVLRIAIPLLGIIGTIVLLSLSAAPKENKY